MLTEIEVTSASYRGWVIFDSFSQSFQDLDKMPFKKNDSEQCKPGCFAYPRQQMAIGTSLAPAWADAVAFDLSNPTARHEFIKFVDDFDAAEGEPSWDDAPGAKSVYQAFSINEAGPSGYTAAFTHPDPMDPNDRQRQKTQARAGNYPYDMPTSYGRATGVDDGGASYQHADDDDDGPLAQELPATAAVPMSVWDNLREVLGKAGPPMENGPTGPLATAMRYGQNGRMGEGGMDAMDLEMDAIRGDFKDSFLAAEPHVRQMKRPELLALLVDLDPDYAVDRFDLDDANLYNAFGDWGHRVLHPDYDDGDEP